MINFLHFSDFHIQEKRGILKEGVDPCLKLEKVIEVARELDVKPAFSIVTGDIAQDGSVKGYTIANEYIQEIEALGGTVIATVGNVDRRKNFRRYMLEDAGEGPCFYSQNVGGLRHCSGLPDSWGRHWVFRRWTARVVRGGAQGSPRAERDRPPSPHFRSALPIGDYSGHL